MKFLLSLAIVILLNGCASSPEERDFFYGGWTKPHKEQGDNSMFR